MPGSSSTPAKKISPIAQWIERRSSKPGVAGSNPAGTAKFKYKKAHADNSAMTEEEIWQWQCEMFIYSCYLYEKENDPVLTDPDFDTHCALLLRAYSKLPKWFTDRVPEDQLSAGTSVGLKYSEDDISGAQAWRMRTKK